MQDLIPTETSMLFDQTMVRLSLTSDYKLAKALKWPPSMVSHYRSGRRCMDPEKILHYALATSTPVEIVLRAAVADRLRKKRNLTSGVLAA